jgi:hypothetical protein
MLLYFVLLATGMHNEWIRLHQDTEKKNGIWYVQAKGSKHGKHKIA